jgi:hypothetical protein
VPRRFNRRLFAIAAAGVLLAAGALLLSEAASADHDSALPVHITVGDPRGASPMARTDPARSGSTEELPERARELWNRGLRGGIEQVPAVDDQGNVVIATGSAELVQLSREGSEQWRARIGVSSATTAPALMSDGTRFVLTAMGEAWGITAQGARKFQVDLSSIGRDARVGVLPRDDGSVAIAVGTRMIVLGADGALRDQADTREVLVGTLIGGRDGILATSENGSVWQWAPPLPPRRVGRFGGSTRSGAALADALTLAAVVDGRRLTTMDLRTGALTTRDTISGLEGPPATAPGAITYAASMAGLLVGLAPASETLRVALTPQVISEDGGVNMSLHSSPPVLCDRHGRVAFVRGDGRIGVVSADGRVTAASAAACYDPLGLAPAGRKRFLVVCRSGTLRVYGE